MSHPIGSRGPSLAVAPDQPLARRHDRDCNHGLPSASVETSPRIERRRERAETDRNDAGRGAHVLEVTLAISLFAARVERTFHTG